MLNNKHVQTHAHKNDSIRSQKRKKINKKINQLNVIKIITLNKQNSIYCILHIFATIFQCKYISHKKTHERGMFNFHLWIVGPVHH